MHVVAVMVVPVPVTLYQTPSVFTDVPQSNAGGSSSVAPSVVPEVVDGIDRAIAFSQASLGGGPTKHRSPQRFSA